MSKRCNDGENSGGGKILKRYNEATVSPDQNSSPAIFKLHAIACEDLFDYLTLKDLHSLGLTCERFNKLTGLYFQENFDIRCILQKDNTIKDEKYGLDISGFSKYLKNIHIHDSTPNQLRYIEAKCISVQVITFNRTEELQEMKFDGLKNILTKVKKFTACDCVLDFNHDRITHDIYDCCLKYCSNLKSLSIVSKYYRNNWLQQIYPKLEELFIFGCRVDEMKTILELNPSIKKLRTNARSLRKNIELFMTTKATLDELGIIFFISEEFESLLPSLIELYSRNFYKRLRISVRNLNEKCIVLLAKLPAVEYLYIYSGADNLTWPNMPNVKKLHHLRKYEFNLNSLILGVSNIEEIFMIMTTFDQILYIINHSKNLKKLAIQELKDGNILDISILNKAREKLVDAQIVNIYLGESIYITTKCKFGHIDFKFIEIRRLGSWNNNYYSKKI